MSARACSRTFKPRELRRKLLLSAQVRVGASWSDACIVNISSRGLMIQSGRPLPPGAEVEVCRGQLAIAARVVWRNGARSGLHAENLIPVDRIMMLGEAPSLQLVASPKPQPVQLRRLDRSRARGRTMEFVGVIAISGALASAGLAMIDNAFAAPLATVAAALG